MSNKRVRQLLHDEEGGKGAKEIQGEAPAQEGASRKTGEFVVAVIQNRAKEVCAHRISSK